MLLAVTHHELTTSHCLTLLIVYDLTSALDYDRLEFIYVFIRGTYLYIFIKTIYSDNFIGKTTALNFKSYTILNLFFMLPMKVSLNVMY